MSILNFIENKLRGTGRTLIMLKDIQSAVDASKELNKFGIDRPSFYIVAHNSNQRQTLMKTMEGLGFSQSIVKVITSEYINFDNPETLTSLLRGITGDTLIFIDHYSFKEMSGNYPLINYVVLLYRNGLLKDITIH